MKVTGKLKELSLLLTSLAVAFIALTNIPAFAGDEVKQCLGCHGRQGIVIHFRNGETRVDTAMSEQQFRQSVHGSISCSSCHADFSEKDHPSRMFKSSKIYGIRLSRACRRCHSDQQLQTGAVHVALLQKESNGLPLSCTDCHSPHTMAHEARGKSMKSESDYCMKCHMGRSDMTFRNKEGVSLNVNLEDLQSSVHRNLSCSDCHFGFSSEEHPERTFSTKRHFSIASSQTCRRCHFDKYSETLESIHFVQLNEGNLKAPVCTDCHGSHSIQKGRTEKLRSARRCEQCHQSVFAIYASSVHGKALIDEYNQDVPICVDCHTAHHIRNPLTLDYREHVPELCGNCHANKAIMGKYGLSTDVVKTYLSDFHGVTLNFYWREEHKLLKAGRPVAVCTDCHGTHDIHSASSSGIAAIKANLGRACRQCHANANKNFPDAWLSHYEPDLHKFPLLFIVRTAFRVFLVLMVAGLSLQILLHLWRYGSDR
jgi:predicted CXXCH cytochrome family protein